MKKVIDNERTISFEGNPNMEFSPDKINLLSVWNLATNKMDKCEYWGDYFRAGFPYLEFGRIGDFDFEVTDNELRLFYGDFLGYGINKSNGLIEFNHKRKVSNFIFIDVIFPAKKFKRPETFLDLMLSISDFLEYLSELKNSIIEPIISDNKHHQDLIKKFQHFN